MKKNRLMMFLIVVLVVLCVGIFWIYNNFINLNKAIDTEYLIVYYEKTTPGSKREIKVTDNIVEITTYFDCSTVICNTPGETKTYTYSEDNIKKLKTYFEKNFAKNNFEVKSEELSEKQNEVFNAIFLGEYFFEINIEEYKYKIEFIGNDSINYDIFLKDDDSIVIKKTIVNEDYDISKIDTYKLEFSKDNLKILSDYITKEANKSKNNVVYKSSSLRADEEKIINSMIENNEKLLDNIKNEPKVSYTILYEGINCYTPILYLYNNNTYEYWYSFTSDNKKIIPKTGTYDFDISIIIKNIDKYSENSYGEYIIKDSDDNNFVTYNTNVELMNLLSSINVTLDKCLIQQ